MINYKSTVNISKIILTKYPTKQIKKSYKILKPKEEERERQTEKGEDKYKLYNCLVYLNPNISIVRLKVNNLNTPIERRDYTIDTNFKNQLYVAYEKPIFNIKYKQMKDKNIKKISYDYIN